MKATGQKALKDGKRRATKKLNNKVPLKRKKTVTPTPKIFELLFVLLSGECFKHQVVLVNFRAH